MNINLQLGDCLEVLKTLEDNSVDAVITDPPYGLIFMNKHWDYDVPSKDVWEQCLRVLKPGGHLLSFGGSRTYHRMAVSVEDAGFEIRDQIIFVYGSGFPKSLNIGKAIDKIEGNEREVIGYVPQFPDGDRGATYRGQANNNNTTNFLVSKDTSTNGLKPVYKKNNDFEGWGTALKPAHEDIVLAKKDGEDLMDIDIEPGFYYGSKASKKDRTSDGLVTNLHPTVKPTELMKYLIKLITPPNGVVLDPFMGSGSTGKAAVQLGHSFIGIERESEYFEIAKARIEFERNKIIQTKLF